VRASSLAIRVELSLTQPIWVSSWALCRRPEVGFDLAPTLAPIYPGGPRNGAYPSFEGCTYGAHL
jgi:hypothetical protein